jgi:hypothetical protein
MLSPSPQLAVIMTSSRLPVIGLALNATVAKSAATNC